MRITLFFMFVFCSQTMFAQMQKIEDLINRQPIIVDSFEAEAVEDAVILLPTDYGASTILSPKVYYDEIQGNTISKIQLVYTDFARSTTFKQPKLNKKRLESLYYIDRSIFENESIVWEIIAQTDIKDVVDGANHFHGFVIYYTPNYASKSSKKLKKILLKSTNGEALPDSTVLNVLDRNKDWNKMLVVADLTGSMTPYTAQIVLWLKLNEKEKRAEHFTFFNDGDEIEDTDKVIGKTGGIYEATTSDFSKILNLALKTMNNGYGGDDPENDIEAILKGMKSCEKCENIVIVADNGSDVRDIALLDLVDKPVKVVLCGVDEKTVINTVYLDIARKTGGSIHTIEKDITNLIQLKEGQIIKIGEFQYQIKKGEFILLDRM